MDKVISIDLIKKYVNGEKIDEYFIEELENDKDFMISVINYTKDFNMYNLCGEELKNNYEFIKYIILKFKDNKKFIINVANNYLFNNDNDLETRELSIIMENNLPDELSLNYKMDNEVLYQEKLVSIELEKNNDSDVESVVGSGFWIIFDDYKDSEIILEYYASHLLDDIIKNNGINLINMIHSHFKTAEELKKMGINKYFLDFINCYDGSLFTYLISHQYLIKKYIDRINAIIKNWDNFNQEDEKNRYLNMLEMVHKYIYTTDTEMDETELVYYTADKLGIKDKVLYYDNYDEKEFDNANIEWLDDYMCSNDLDENELIGIETMIEYIKNSDIDYEIDYYIENSLKERMIFFNVRKIMINQVFSNNPSDNIDSILNKKVSGVQKIIKFKREK